MSFQWQRSYAKLNSTPRVMEKARGRHNSDVSSDEENPEIRADSQRWTSITGLYYMIPAIIILLVGLAYTVFHLNSILHDSSTGLGDQNLPCGNSSAEALSLGCSFDHLTWAWLAPSCPRYANEQFIMQHDWKYYYDRHGTEEITSESLTGELDMHTQVWTQHGEHSTHCVFMLLTLGQILRDGTRYSEIHAKYDHVDHCARLLLGMVKRDKDFNKIDTPMPEVKYITDC